MTMSNGSILVVGGEVGSNGDAQPNLELLPRVGPVLEMEWLQRCVWREMSDLVQ